jgi:phenylacetate-CoA ligase
MSRSDIALKLETIVPLDAELTRLIVYDTSGVTGHAIIVPHHPRAMAQYHPMLEYVMEQYGIKLPFSSDITACINVGCQVNTVTFGNVFSVWNQAGFAKVNLHERVWSREKAQQFFSDTAPLFLTGDPLGFAQMAAWGIEARPAAMISTAVALLPALKSSLEERYHCPVIDLYSSTETGPVAFTNPAGKGMVIFAPDLYVEIVDEDGWPVAEGESGEICVTGGRNPYLPLLRYRTGDYGRIDRRGSELPLLHDLQAREPVSFIADDGTVISMIDVSRIIREWPLVQHEFIQNADCSCDLRIQPLAGYPIDRECIKEKLIELFGQSTRISVALDERLGDNRQGGKVIPFSCQITAAQPAAGVK